MNICIKIITVGNDPASRVYVGRKQKACAQVGMTCEAVRFGCDLDEETLHDAIREFGRDPLVHGIIVQTPLPRGWDMQRALDAVPVAKDIDGLSRASAELRRKGAPETLLPATPLGVMRLLSSMGVDLHASRVAVIGKGMVGAPLREMLAAAGATVIGINKDTPEPAMLAKTCDVVITATGVAKLVNDAWVKPGSIVIDVGITRQDEGLLGDVDQARVEGIASIITPVPGGVGPMTVASLMTNIADAACLQVGRPRTAWVIDAKG